MKREELKEILEKHKRWLNESEGWSEDDRANLRGANLLNADLRGVNLRDADLCDADLCDAENMPFIPYACPDFGIFIGFKKAQGFIVVLEIPEDAKRLSATGGNADATKQKCFRFRIWTEQILALQKLHLIEIQILSTRSERMFL